MTIRWLRAQLWLAVLPLLYCMFFQPAFTQTAFAPVYVTLWFDTEDYILPQSDDAAKRLAETLTGLGVRATFKIVGEKARVLEQRGRIDVIRALQKHDIGYHTDWHSRHPVISVYLQNAGWDEGIAEFLRREGSGAADIRRIFGVQPVCYGQPGSAWAPQAYPALRTLGIRMYLDEARHVGLDSQPFYYGGMLNVFNLGTAVVRMELGLPDNLSRARNQFQQACETLRARGGGTISIYYHPCEFVHAEFWDGVNFGRGKNPARSDWKLPPTKPVADAEKGFSDFEQYIGFIKEQPGVRFVTATDLMRLYADQASEHRFTRSEIRALALGVRSGITFQRLGLVAVSAAELFWLLNQEVMAVAKTGELPPTDINVQFLDGPARTFGASGSAPAPSSIPWSAFAGTVMDVEGYCRSRWRVPHEIWIGAQSISPEAYLTTIAGLLNEIVETGHAPAEVRLEAGTLIAEKYVARDAKNLWGWVIFPEGFHAPALMELARLQAWTLKPALLKQ